MLMTSFGITARVHESLRRGFYGYAAYAEKPPLFDYVHLHY